MATLVLTVVGGLVGGPIGAAVGALAGQQIDRNVLFAPKGRQGPRLTELALQTSSYGTPIAHVFGTMRIGGCVIWSTDLIESRATSRSGKGQPSVTNYSYSASFAVALSGRAISGVGRIWADGKLLRGSAGDFKTSTGFRLHLGGEDQAVDPLIASAEGGLAPAHRGIAYAVFEHLQLADFGNRIPSLTFEVIGDAAPVPAGAIAAAVSGGLVRGDVALTLPGFAAYGDARGVLELLGAASGAWFVPEGRTIVLRDGTSANDTLDDAGLGAGDLPGLRGVRTLGAIEAVPQTVTIAHYDAARDYQRGLQRARRPGAGHRAAEIELPASVSADMAKTIAERELARGEAGRERRTLAMGWDALGVLPGACVRIAGTPGVYRVARWSFEQSVLRLECVRLAGATAPARASPGRALPAPDILTGRTILHAFEIPPLDDTVLSAPRLIVAAAGTAPGWRQAALLYSLDDGARWLTAGATAGVATVGVLAGRPGAASANVIDLINQIEINLAHAGMALNGADDVALDAGANIALLGEELIQFGDATQISQSRWRLSRLLRGRRGTEAAIGLQQAGDRFILIEADAALAIELPLTSIGTTVRFLASGIGDAAGPIGATAAVRGGSVLPLAPVHLWVDAQASGDLLIRWVRRSRAGWRWIDGAETPLAEENEAYRVTLRTASGIGRTVETALPELLLAASERAAIVSIEVRQAGLHGESPASAIALPAM
ncbi:phage tail protein [Sphingomonas qilianensis]|uniref:Phage tail protein n=1 Tax=Sphingomonas qilianensis TaxID=1736690 RepID=A0ABU9XRM8_9SPHN